MDKSEIMWCSENFPTLHGEKSKTFLVRTRWSLRSLPMRTTQWQMQQKESVAQISMEITQAACEITCLGLMAKWRVYCLTWTSLMQRLLRTLFCFHYSVLPGNFSSSVTERGFKIGVNHINVVCTGWVMVFWLLTKETVARSVMVSNY